MIKTRIIQDGPTAHEDVARAWARGGRCVVVPFGFEDPRNYVEAHPGGPGIFLYMANNRGGFDLVHVTWQQLQQRLEGQVTRPLLTGRVLSMFDNRWGYGLVLGRLYPVYHGGTVVPYRGSPRRAIRSIAAEKIDTVICIAELLSGPIPGEPPCGDLKAIINVCRPLSSTAFAVLSAHFKGVKIYNLFGLGRCGIIAMSNGERLEPGEQGDLVAPAEIRDGELFVKSSSTYPDFDLGDGWCATGKRARIDGTRLFIDGDIGAQ